MNVIHILFAVLIVCGIIYEKIQKKKDMEEISKWIAQPVNTITEKMIEDILVPYSSKFMENDVLTVKYNDLSSIDIKKRIVQLIYQ